MEAAHHGAEVELVGRVGEDLEGEALMIALSRAGVGHAAVLRDPAHPTATETLPRVLDGDQELLDDAASAPVLRTAGPVLDAADVALGLSYIGEFRVLVVTDGVPAGVLSACVAGAAFTGAQLVVIVPAGAAAPDGLPESATVLEAPDDTEAGAFAALVGRYAAGLDEVVDPAEAFAAAVAGEWDSHRA